MSKITKEKVKGFLFLRNHNYAVYFLEISLVPRYVPDYSTLGCLSLVSLFLTF